MMNVKELWRKVFSRESFPVKAIEQEEAQEVMQVRHDYGLNVLSVALSSEDFGWEPKPFKKVRLTNVRDCENKITVMGAVSTWRGTGHSEWEFLLAGIFVTQVTEALEAGLEEADITSLFDRNLLASRGRKFTQEQIYNHLIGCFDVIEDSEEVLRLAIRLAN